MDYITKPVGRLTLRNYAKIFRKICDVPDDGPFPVLECLEKIPDIFDGSFYEVVENDALPKNVIAQCEKNSGKGFNIKVKQFVYDGAMKGTGAYLGFILHEIVHIFMYEIGYKPIFQRSFSKAPLYCRVEWQVKALTGEIAMPYEYTEGMSEREIIKKYHVSRGFAKKRMTY